MRRLPALALLCFCGASNTFTLTVTGPSSDPTVGVLPSYNDTYANWKNAGLLSIGDIPNRTTQCGATVAPSGITPPASGDDAAKINAAIAACGSGQVVQLAAGTFNIVQSEIISLNKGVTLRGTGACNNASSPYCSTVITVINGAIPDWTISPTTAGTQCGTSPASHATCSAATAMILVSPSGNFNWGWAGCFLGTNPTNSNCGATLVADIAQGATTVQVSSTSKFSVGMFVLIDENPAVISTANPTGGSNVNASPDWLSNSGSPATMRLAGGDLPSSYSLSPNRVNSEIHLITAIGPGPCPGANCTLTFDDPLTLAFRQSGGHDARVYWPTVQGATNNPFLQKAGVENLTLTRPGNGGISFMFCAYCWAKNVEIGTWVAGSVNVNYSLRTQIEGNYFHDCADCENNGAEYPLGISSAATETYVVNNIIVRGGKGMVGRASNTSVIAYNYVDDTFYMQSVIGDYWQDMGLNGSHYGGTHHWLFEGNWADNCDNDETHGNAIYHTYFRNDCTGLRTAFTDPSNNKTVDDANGIAWANGNQTQPAPLRAAGPMAFNYWMAYVGNVLGTAGQTNAAHGWVYSAATGNKSIWKPGWTGSEWPGPDSNLQNAVSPNFIFRQGNYDYFNSAIVDWTAGFTQTLPASFYLSAQPAFFSSGLCGYTWPWIAPDGAQQVHNSGCGGSGLPAKSRFDAGTPFVQP